MLKPVETKLVCEECGNTLLAEVRYADGSVVPVDVNRVYCANCKRSWFTQVTDKVLADLRRNCGVA